MSTYALKDVYEMDDPPDDPYAVSESLNAKLAKVEW